MQALRSNRLLLEPQTTEHAAEMFDMLADPAIYRHENAPPPSLAWLAARFARLEQRRSHDGREHWLNWVVRLAPAGLAIGYVQATVRADGRALVAYVFNSRHWGRGYASEAVQTMLDELAARWGVRLALAVLKRDNLRSLALLRRQGFQSMHVEPADGHAVADVEPDECLMAKPLLALVADCTIITPLRPAMSSTPPHNRVALVTGAGSGIGLGCAAALVADGWRVVYTGRRAEALQAAIGRAGDPFGDITSRAMAIPCDVGDEASVAALFDGVRERFGRLDLLFNNAGISLPVQTPDEIDAATWRRAVDTNLNGAFFCLSQAFKLMRAQSPQGGRIINNGSISAHAPRPGSIAYTATKHAITGLTRAASLDGRAFDIAVGQIDIGNVASDMTERMAKGVPQADGSIKPEARMELQSVVDGFMSMARLPLASNVLFMTVMATKMPFVGRG